MATKNIYVRIIEDIFFSKFKPKKREVKFKREDIIRSCKRLNIKIPKNLGDLIYTFRFRSLLPDRIRETAAKDHEWIIRLSGTAADRFSQVPIINLEPNKNMITIKVPDATPSIVEKYALTDEQALLAKVRYNRLIDIFTGVACYSLQNHLRTTLPSIGQIETDEVYIGVNKQGEQFIFPVQAKGGKDRLGLVQIEQDIALCDHKFSLLTCRPIGAQFMAENVIALFEFAQEDDSAKIVCERHYKLVPSDDISDQDLKKYKKFER